MSKKLFNSETLVAAIKEVAAAIVENGGAEIKARVVQTAENEVRAHIIVEPYRFISAERRK